MKGVRELCDETQWPQIASTAVDTAIVQMVPVLTKSFAMHAQEVSKCRFVKRDYVNTSSALKNSDLETRSSQQ